MAGQGRKPITAEFYRSIVDAFREELAIAGGDFEAVNIAHAARRARIDRATARRAWTEGWVAGKPPRMFARPVYDVLSEEVVRARAATPGSLEAEALRREREADRLLADARRESEAIRAQARADAEAELARAHEEAQAKARRALEELRTRAEWNSVEARVREGMMVTYSREAVISVLGILGQIVDAAPELARRVLAMLQSPSITPLQATAIVEKITRMLKNVTDAGMLTLQMERTFLGKPGQIVETRITTTDEALALIDVAARAAERVKRRQQAALPVAVEDVGDEAEAPHEGKPEELN